MKKKYVVTLTEEERRMLRKMISQGNAAARKLMHAHILLKADQSKGGPNWEDAAIAQGLDVGTATVERVRKRFVEEGLQAALDRRQDLRHIAHGLAWPRSRPTHSTREPPATLLTARPRRPDARDNPLHRW